jgi:quercetin dioxygenase-like cupin family protein
MSRTLQEENVRNLIAGILIFTAGAAVGALQQQAQTTRREPQFENSEVRVWKSIIMPNQPLALHRHDHGRTIVALKGGTLDIVDGKGQTTKQEKWESGKAYWLDADPPGTQHGDLNKGKEPMEVIVVELKNDVKK